MSRLAIRATGLGKCYAIGSQSAVNESRGLSDLRRAFFGSRGEPYWALRDLSFEIEHGEIVGIIGSNGAGKSTLLKILSRVVQPTTGSAEIHGRFGSLLEVGTGFHPELTGRENIYMSGVILGMSRADVTRRFDEIVAFSGVERFLDTPIKRYSSGMQTRLGFAVAAHLEPEILIVDEVLAVGDAEFQKKCLGKMRDVAGHGRTVLFVSHNMNAIQSLCTRVIWLDKGAVCLNDTNVPRATRSYLSRGGDADRAEWRRPETASGRKQVEIHALRLIDETGATVTQTVPINAPLFLEFDLDISDIDPSLQVGYAIYAEDGERLWWSYQTDSDPRDWPPLHTGRMLLRTALPRQMLNEGRYHIEFVSCLHLREWIVPPGGPSIGFTIEGGLCTSPFWVTSRPARLAPVLYWEEAESDRAAPRMNPSAREI
ncbi:MAG: ATP-binding cassette domain-containing protein [Rhizobiales bacterium]|nr:ATP-binding cassette domain-containing protein [Hyphomicrobiales bacterium]